MAYYPQQFYPAPMGTPPMHYPMNTGMMPQPSQNLSNFSQQGLKGRPVSSVDEVRAAQIDFDGSLFVFPDIANQRIYTKQINLDGTASLNTYQLCVDMPKEANNSPIDTNNFVTKEEFEKFKSTLNVRKDEHINEQQSANAVNAPTF